MRITMKTPSGRDASLWSEGCKVFAAAHDCKGLLPLSDMDWLRDEGFCDYVIGKITGIKQPVTLPANGEVNI